MCEWIEKWMLGLLGWNFWSYAITIWSIITSHISRDILPLVSSMQLLRQLSVMVPFFCYSSGEYDDRNFFSNFVKFSELRIHFGNCVASIATRDCVSVNTGIPCKSMEKVFFWLEQRSLSGINGKIIPLLRLPFCPRRKCIGESCVWMEWQMCTTIYYIYEQNKVSKTLFPSQL